MPSPNPEAIEFLLARRSHPAKLQEAPGPGRAELDRILTAGVRVPDHGKLEPWRLIVLEGAALARFAEAVRARAEATGAEADKGAIAFERAPVCVAVVAAPKDSEKIPRIEQTLSAGAVCLSLVNAALACGWGASWLTGWPAYDRALLEDALGLGGAEWIAGFIYIGTASGEAPPRPRPDLAALADWRSE